MHPSTSSLSILLPLVLAPVVAAQQSKFIPAANATTEGTTLSVYPFGYTNPRCQQIWTGSSITSATGVINNISYRSDSNRTGALPGRSYTGVKVELGVTSMTPATMTTTFATNRTGAMTTVLSGNFNLPPQIAPLPGTQPFNITFAMSSPFIYNARSGDLLLDITLPGAIGKSNYFVDAEYSGGSTGGTVSRFGMSGSFGGPEVFSLAADAPSLTPGGALATTCGPFSKGYAGTLVLGLSNSIWNGNNLPLSLAPLGAPGNNLYVSMTAQLPFNAMRVGQNYQSGLKTSIPNTPVYSGLSFYLQAYYADAQANSAGLVTTHALALRTAGSSGPETNQVGNYDSTKPTGNFAFGTTRQGGPVTRFHGVLP